MLTHAQTLHLQALTPRSLLPTHTLVHTHTGTHTRAAYPYPHHTGYITPCFSSVYVKDGGYPTLYDIATVFVQVSDINDHPPVFEEEQYQLQVPENQPQSSIITIAASDLDAGVNADINYRISGQ